MSIGTLFTLFVLPAVYVVLATDHGKKAASERNKQIEAMDLGSKALRPT
jgi:multidrug efflux pump